MTNQDNKPNYENALHVPYDKELEDFLTEKSKVKKPKVSKPKKFNASHLNLPICENQTFDIFRDGFVWTSTANDKRNFQQ